jgi:hypothetical protein
VTAEGGITRYVQGWCTRIAGPPCGRVGRTPSKSPDFRTRGRCREFRSETSPHANKVENRVNLHENLSYRSRIKVITVDWEEQEN